MELGKWYILSDSGSFYTPLGFVSPADAQRWWNDEGKALYEMPADHVLTVPKFADGAWAESDSPQVMKADDLLDFWLREDPEVIADED
jgi:hypothetical protein